MDNYRTSVLEKHVCCWEERCTKRNEHVFTGVVNGNHCLHKTAK